jgi:hypothetical protein
MASSDVVKGSRHDAITVNDVYLDDGRSTTSPAQVDGRQSGHSAPSSSAARSFHPGPLSACYWARIAAPTQIQARGSPAARYAVSAILFSYCTIETVHQSA